MKVSQNESLFAIKFDVEGERDIVERAANAVIVERAKAVKNETDNVRRAEVNEGILAVGALVKRVKDNRAPVYLTPVEEGLVVSEGEEGSTVFHEDEVRILKEVLSDYSGYTADAVPGYTGGGGLSPKPVDRAYYGFVAGYRDNKLGQYLAPSQAE